MIISQTTYFMHTHVYMYIYLYTHLYIVFTYVCLYLSIKNEKGFIVIRPIMGIFFVLNGILDEWPS